MSRRILTGKAPPNPLSGTAIITDPLEIRRLLNRAASGRTASSLKIRSARDLAVFEGSLLDVDPVRDGIQLELDRLGIGIKEVFEGEDCILTIFLQGRSILGINAVPTEIHDNIVVFATPKRLFKIQRRKDVRFQIPAAYEFTVELSHPQDSKRERSSRGPKVRRRLIDLSENGLSFLLTDQEEIELFLPGTILRECRIRMQNRKIDVSLDIRNHLPFGQRGRTKSNAGIKVGAEFEDIAPEDRDYIAQFVYSHAAHLFY